MPTGQAGDGISLYYEDSGAPNGGSTAYTTAILVHGTMFHSAIFRRMIPYAAAHDLRLVLLNLRDYPGSTRYTAEELALLAGPDRASQEAAIQARGRELAAFMCWFIEAERVPPIADAPGAGQQRRGGVSLVGWSSGNCQTMPVFAHADKLPRETRVRLGAYLRSFVLHDASLTAIGEAAPEGLYSPFRNASLTYDQRILEFPIWVSTYWAQEDIASQSPAYAATVAARKELHHTEEGARWLPSFQRILSDELAALADFDVMPRSQVLIQRVDTAIYQENLRRALSQVYVEEDGVKQPVWPALKVCVGWCDMSVGEELWAASKIRQEYSELTDRRDMEMFRVEEANHLVHWDEPEKFTKFLARVV